MTDEFSQSDEPTGYDDAGPRWWSRDALLEPRAGSLFAIVLAVLSLITVEPASIINAVAIERDRLNLRWNAVTPGIHLAIAFLAALAAVWVIARGWEQAADWSGALARAALLVAGVSLVLNVAAFALALSTGQPHEFGFFSNAPVPTLAPQIQVPQIPACPPSPTPAPDAVVCIGSATP